MLLFPAVVPETTLAVFALDSLLVLVGVPPLTLALSFLLNAPTIITIAEYAFVQLLDFPGALHQNLALTFPIVVTRMTTAEDV